MRICQICCRLNLYRATQMSLLLCLWPHFFLGQKSYLRFARKRWRRDSRRRAHPQLTPSRRAVASHSPLPAAWQRRPLNPVARALASPKSGPRARTRDEVGGKEEPAVHPRSPSSPAPHARRWRLHQPACPSHAPMARTGCGCTEPFPFHASTAGTCKACHRSRLWEGGSRVPPGGGV